jgi:hypothetical protein
LADTSTGWSDVSAGHLPLTNGCHQLEVGSLSGKSVGVRVSLSAFGWRAAVKGPAAAQPLAAGTANEATVRKCASAATTTSRWSTPWNPKTKDGLVPRRRRPLRRRRERLSDRIRDLPSGGAGDGSTPRPPRRSGENHFRPALTPYARVIRGGTYERSEGAPGRTAASGDLERDGPHPARVIREGPPASEDLHI